MYTIWGRPNCKWCEEAKRFLKFNFIDYEYIELTPENLNKFSEITNGAKTVPQIFDSYNNLIGSYEELVDYIYSTELD